MCVEFSVLGSGVSLWRRATRRQHVSKCSRLNELIFVSPRTKYEVNFTYFSYLCGVKPDVHHVDTPSVEWRGVGGSKQAEQM